MKRLYKIITYVVAVFLLQACFRPGHLYMVTAWKVRNESDMKIIVTFKYSSLYYKDKIYTVTREIIPSGNDFLMVNSCIAKEEYLVFDDLFGKDINVFDGYMSFVDPETGDEVCRYDLNYNADNVLSRDFFDESSWEMLDGAEFVAGEFGRGNGEPYRQWSFTVTDEYIQ